VLATYAFQAHRGVLDVGGGQGTFLSRLACHAPHLQLNLFDLPQVAALAQANFNQQGLTERARVFGGDFLHDALPQVADSSPGSGLRMTTPITMSKPSCERFMRHCPRAAPSCWLSPWRNRW